MNIDDILRAAENKAREKAEKFSLKVTKAAQKKVDAVSPAPTPKQVVPERAVDPRVEKIIAEAASKLVEKERKKIEKKIEQKKLRNQKVTDRTPDLRLTYEFALEIYEKTALLPMQSIYWFYEPKEQYPLVNKTIVSNDGKYATPLGAWCLLKLEEIRASRIPSAHARFVSLFDEPSHKWVVGSISTLLDLTPSYVLGFGAGFDGQNEGHSQCSRHYHCGFEDGKALLERFLAEHRLKLPTEDPFTDIQDPEKLDELYRVCGYRRAGHVPYQKRPKLEAARKSVKDLRRESMGNFFKG